MTTHESGKEPRSVRRMRASLLSTLLVANRASDDLKKKHRMLLKQLQRLRKQRVWLELQTELDRMLKLSSYDE